MKLTLNAAAGGYTGTELQGILRGKGVECEFADRQYLVLMPSAETTEPEWARLFSALRGITPGQPLADVPPALPAPERVLGIREAMLSPQEALPVEQAAGRILTDACVSCPPAVPVLIAGERITEEAVECMKYYGVETCMAVKSV